MLATDENALICDLAETYGIFDYRALPVSLLATLSVGLRDNSRIKLRLAGAKAPQEIILLASMVDRLSSLVWMKTKDGQRGRNKPKSILSILLGEEKESEIQTFDTAEAFEAAKAKILEGVNHGN